MTGIAEDHPDFRWVKPCLDTQRLVYIGLRDVDDAEKKILKDHNIKAYSMHHVDKYGIGKVLDMALDDVNPDRNRPIHLSFDVDALDPTVAPSTVSSSVWCNMMDPLCWEIHISILKKNQGTPVRGGLSFREGHYICEALAETKLLVSTDIVEVNPELEDEKAAFQTIQVGCSLARCCLGESLL